MNNDDVTKHVAQLAAVRDEIGPYWDLNRRHDWLSGRREACAANAAEALLAGDLKSARRYAKDYRMHDDAVKRLWQRHDAIKDTDAKWIGWEAYRSYGGRL